MNILGRFNVARTVPDPGLKNIHIVKVVLLNHITVNF
jgi:hypothetical protein